MFFSCGIPVEPPGWAAVAPAKHSEAATLSKGAILPKVAKDNGERKERVTCAVVHQWKRTT